MLLDQKLTAISDLFSTSTQFPIIAQEYSPEATDETKFVEYNMTNSTTTVAVSSFTPDYSYIFPAAPIPNVTITITPEIDNLQDVMSPGLPNNTNLITLSRFLPPATATAVPSLNVINLAKVGALQIGDKLGPPISVFGSDSDRAGMIRFDAEDGLWYCVGDFTGIDEIWKRISYDAVPAPIAPSAPIGYNPTYKLVGSPTDRPGDLRRLGNTLFVCIGNFNGWANIWKPVQSVFDPTYFTALDEYTASGTSDLVNYPSRWIATNYACTVKPKNTSPIVTSGVGPSPYTSDSTYLYLASSNSYSVYMPNPGSSYPTGWRATILNTSSSYKMTLYPYSGSGNTIDGMTSLVIPPRTSIIIHWVGTSFQTVARPRNRFMITLTPGTTVAVDALAGTNFSLTMGGNYTLSNPTGLLDGDILTFKIYQSGSTARTLSYGTMYKWPGGTVPAVSVGTGKIDIITARYDASNSFLYCDMIKDIK